MFNKETKIINPEANAKLKVVPLDFGETDSPEELAFLTSATEIAISAFGWHQSDETTQNVVSILRNKSVLFMYEGQLPVGFVSYRYFDLAVGKVVHISGMAVKRERQGRDLGSKLARDMTTLLENEGKNVDFISGVTQNPAVVKSRKKYCSTVYPIDVIPPLSIQELAVQLNDARGRTWDLDSESLVVHNFYSHPLYETRPTVNDPHIDTFFEDNVGPCDAVLIVGIPT